MGQHNRTVTCTRCSSAASLKVAVAHWTAITRDPAKWICPDCAAAAKRPAVVATGPIRLSRDWPRQVVNDHAPFRELPTMAAVSRQVELPPARQAPLNKSPPHLSTSGRLRWTALAGAMLLLGTGAVSAPDSEEDRVVLDMRERLDELGAPYTLMMSRSQLQRFQASTRYREALKRLRVEAVVDPSHQDNSMTVVVVQVRGIA